ncbi:putative Serine proteinase stubble [Hypsibius exemplaris]|uniref:Serine proteinase stubble n=1 Tax=Hypsibius exemplaris TaxID=2072580 RepID=A0A1W0X2G4_HYPEX|nr:putative Serine proteinase stubble [Hypsibius exemplaris]
MEVLALLYWSLSRQTIAVNAVRKLLWIVCFGYTVAAISNGTNGSATSDLERLFGIHSKITPRLSAWENGHADCQAVDRDSICRSRSACPSRNVLQPTQHCRLVSSRSVFGRTLTSNMAESITSRSGQNKMQGVCCHTETAIAASESPFETQPTAMRNNVDSNDSGSSGNAISPSVATESAAGVSFDIMPYAALMAQSTQLSNMLLSSAQNGYGGQAKHKNFSQINIADLGLDCGRRNLSYKMIRVGRIVGGETAGFSDWPWVAMVLNYGRPRCGGTLLSSQAILTAAHCVSGNMLLYNLTVRIGMFNTNERESLPFPPLLLRVKRIIRHPMFDLTTLLNDVAILQLSQPVTFAPNIMPACIASQEYPYNTPTTILGWGKEEENNTVYDLPDSLQAVTVPIINKAECARYFAGQGLVDLIGQQHICAGSDEGGRDACQGDSGGPMLLENPDGRFELLGIISWGFGCGEPHVPGVYTNIFNYRRWIIDTVAALF